MATKLWASAVTATVDTVAVAKLQTTQTPGPATNSNAVATAAGPSIGGYSGATWSTWLSDPLPAAITISGLITINMWTFESAAQANVGAAIRIMIVASALDTSVDLGAPAKGVEMGTASALQSWTFTPPITLAHAGDKIKIFFEFTDAGGVQTAGRTSTMVYNGATPGASGDTWVQFTEDLFLVPAGRRAQPPLGMTQAVQRVATRCWARRRSGIVVPRLWVPSEA